MPSPFTSPTAGQLAAAAGLSYGLSYGAVRNIDQGQREPTWESVVKVSKVLSVLPEVFLPTDDDAADHKPAPVGRPKNSPPPSLRAADARGHVEAEGVTPAGGGRPYTDGVRRPAGPASAAPSMGRPMKTELCLRARGSDRVLGSVVLAGRVGLDDAAGTSQAAALAAAYTPGHARPFVAADHGCYWTRQDCR